MGLSDSELDALIAESKIFDNHEYETRMIQGLNNLCLGLKLLERLFQNHGMCLYDAAGITKKAAVEGIVDNIKLSLDGNGKVKSAVETSLEIMDRMALRGRLRQGEHYSINVPMNELRLRLNLIYDEFTKYIAEHRIEDTEILSGRQFTKYLKKAPYVKFNESVNRDFTVPCREDYQASKTITAKCWVLHLDMVNQYMDLDAFYCDAKNNDEKKEEFTSELPDYMPFT